MIEKQLTEAIAYAKSLTPQQLFEAEGDAARAHITQKDARITNALVWQAMKLQDPDIHAESLQEACEGSAYTMLEVDQLCYELYDAINAYTVTVTAA